MPGTIDVFTEASAWTLIGQLLLNGTEVTELVLNQPQGKTAYVMLAPGANNELIYIKLELGGSMVIARSFHISERKGS
jgi:hypothetical protein